MSAADIAPALRRLLERLQPYAVNWNPSGDQYVLGRDRTTEELDGADVISSQIKSPLGTQSHVVALDIDYPVHVVESSTPGHFHLYMEVPGGVPHEGYMALIALLGHLRIIEPNYASVSLQRGHTDLRLPWVKKGDEPGRKRDFDQDKAVF